MTEKTKIIPAGATRILVCIDDVTFREPKGTWISLHYNVGNSFKSFIDLITQVDAHYDEKGFVQQSIQYRSYHNKNLKNRAGGKLQVINQTPESTGEKATFIVQVMFRQNATWQGKVKWVETGEETMFRSTLELLKLMDEAIISKDQ